jgi:hypothetical protein
MRRGLRWVWPAIFAAAVGVAMSAPAQQATVTPIAPGEERTRGTDVTPELFMPRPLTGKAELEPPTPPAAVTSERIVPPRLAPVPGSQPIVPAPLAPPVEGDVDTARTDPAETPTERQPQMEGPIQPEQPKAEPPPEPSPEKQTVQPTPTPKRPREARRRQPEAPKAAQEQKQKKSAPSAGSRQKREAKARNVDPRPSSRTDPPLKITPPIADEKSRGAGPRTQSPSLSDPRATREEIIAAFRTLGRGEQQRVRQRCVKLLAAPREAAANELRVCRAL